MCQPLHYGIGTQFLPSISTGDQHVRSEVKYPELVLILRWGGQPQFLGGRNKALRAQAGSDMMEFCDPSSSFTGSIFAGSGFANLSTW